MGVAQRREREREQLRSHIVESARDLLLEHGLSGLSMRAIAERIEYSPATIYLYFRDKDELVQAVVETGFERLQATMAAELAKLPETASAADQYGSTGRAYARFGVENPAYFRLMFELPGSSELDCGRARRSDGAAFEDVVSLVRRAAEGGDMEGPEPRRIALIGWGLIHGLTTLYLSGHLHDEAPAPEDFFELIEDAMRSMNMGWRGRTAAGEGK
jgi:AcrR family transcriptional regulator